MWGRRGKPRHLLIYDAPTVTKPTPVTVGSYPVPNTAPGSISDFYSQTQWSNDFQRRDWLGMNLNRPLRDYRVDVNAPLSSSNIVSGPQLTSANNDRMELAKDIFKRLVVAVGATAYVDPETGLPVPVSSTAWRAA